MGGPVSLPDLELALAELPLFPLPHVVLFPGAFLPLHVFEPRYVALVRHVLARHRSLAVPQLREERHPPARPKATPSAARAREPAEPPIVELAGAGTIVDFEELPGGRYDIVVLGRARVRLEELPFVPPFRRARATVAPSTERGVSASDVTALHAAARAFTQSLPDEPGRRRGRSPLASQAPGAGVPSGTTAGAVADAYAATLVLDGRDRQRVLEALSVRERVQRVTEI
ncbi:MAG: LON peptidase substrate-binding domain-containing protein, partial [Polyangiaceae bacterium]|nr:LON peptidase substrate-binding domain-containing protein [Polyangiaceae bacterium]